MLGNLGQKQSNCLMQNYLTREKTNTIKCEVGLISNLKAFGLSPIEDEEEEEDLSERSTARIWEQGEKTGFHSNFCADPYKNGITQIIECSDAFLDKEALESSFNERCANKNTCKFNFSRFISKIDEGRRNLQENGNTETIVIGDNDPDTANKTVPTNNSTAVIVAQQNSTVTNNVTLPSSTNQTNTETETVKTDPEPVPEPELEPEADLLQPLIDKCLADKSRMYL
jgi:hypothetical protein